MIKSYSEYLESINEKTRYYIYQGRTRVGDLYETYNASDIEKWKQRYNLDDIAYCIFVSKDKVKEQGQLTRLSERGLKNKISFGATELGAGEGLKDTQFDGYLVEDSKKIIDGQEIYLWVFYKGSNIERRARQIHGFIYEGEIRRLNGLENTKWTHKWDAKGTLDKNFFDDRVDEGKFMEYFDGQSYKPLNDKSGKIMWNKVPTEFKANLNWSIKSIKSGSSIEMGDFLRIAGLEREGGKIRPISDNTQNFILQINLHDGTPAKKSKVEYTILISVEQWKSFLPTINLDEFQKMYDELFKHRLRNERTPISEDAWESYMSKYKKLSEGSAIKLRFKRDSEGQLRIQCAINSQPFRDQILKKCKHIKIAPKP